MNIYLFERVEYVGWHEYNRFLLAAPTEDRAREMASEKTSEDGEGPWPLDTDTEILTVRLIGHTDDAEQIYMTSYRGEDD